MSIYCLRPINLRQPQQPSTKAVEEAATICQLGQRLLWGSRAKGTSPTSVSLFTSCPKGGKPIGVHHTHPGGRAEPSLQDIAAMKRAELRHLCISDDSITRCFQVR